MPGGSPASCWTPAGGDPLWERTPDRALVPGSTGKLLTAAAALLTLHPTAPFVTRVVAGPDPGTVVLVGGGDPTLTALPAGRDSVYPDAPRLADLAEQVQQAAPGPITTVLVDTSRYTGPTLAEGWVAADIPGGYVAPIESLMVDGGRIDAHAAGRPAGAGPGADGRPRVRRHARRRPGHGQQPAPRRRTRRQLGAVSSAPVTDLVEHLLRSSDNVLAEALRPRGRAGPRRRAVLHRGRRAGAGRARAGRLRPHRRGDARRQRAVHRGPGAGPAARFGARRGGRPGAAARGTASGCARWSPACRWPAATARSTTGSRPTRRPRRAAAWSGPRPAR